MKQIPCNMMMKGPQKDLFKQEMVYDEPQLVSRCVLNKIVSLLKVTLVVFSILEKKQNKRRKDHHLLNVLLFFVFFRVCSSKNRALRCFYK